MSTFGILLFTVTPGFIIMIAVLVVIIAVFIVLYILGKKAQKKQDEQQAMMQANKQYVTMLVIDKKKLSVTKSGLPQTVINQTPKYLRWQKLPVVKAKVGPQMVTLISDDKIFDSLPLKKEIKAGVSGLYIVDFKGAHGKIAAPEKKQKKGFARLIEKLQEKAGAKPL
ncbi:MAG: hypothetical protein IJ796_10800 [Lachnospiraceae bacterium]|nr:hypothetical protein [Lachnospiraceae bacterium]